MLKITNLSKSYGSFVAVDNLSLHVQQGDIYGFIGHNGAGKTTTLRCIAGILDFTDGDIQINGLSVRADSLQCKRVTCYIPDNPELYEHLTAIRYINFVSDMYDVPVSERNARIQKYSKAFDIDSKLGDLIGSMSHGMKQKVALIAAMVTQPKLLLLDEPFVGLDPLAAHALKGFMSEMCQNGGAIFFSTHVLEVAEKLCNKIAIIKQGRLVVAGKTDEVRGNSSLEELFLELSEK